MQLVSFVHARRPGFGIRAKGGLINVGARLGREFSSLAEVLRAGALNKLDEMAYLSADLDIASVEMLPPIPHPAKIICVGLNYKSHAANRATSCRKIRACFCARSIPWSALGSR